VARGDDLRDSFAAEFARRMLRCTAAVGQSSYPRRIVALQPLVDGLARDNYRYRLAPKCCGLRCNRESVGHAGPWFCFPSRALLPSMPSGNSEPANFNKLLPCLRIKVSPMCPVWTFPSRDREGAVASLLRPASSQNSYLSANCITRGRVSRPV
jgi:hypothetical protein